MVRVSISASCVGDFVKTETGIINAEKYYQILTHHVVILPFPQLKKASD